VGHEAKNRKQVAFDVQRLVVDRRGHAAAYLLPPFFVICHIAGDQSAVAEG
jgi:hypothetical protein